MEGWVEPEPALGGERRVHPHVGDQEAVAKSLAVRLQSHQRPHRAAAAVGGDQIVASEVIGAVRRLDAEGHTLGRRAHGARAVAPAQIDPRQRLRAFQQERLDIVLLEVDESGPAVPRLRQQVEPVGERVAEKHASYLPAHALFDHSLAAAEPVENLQRALGEADRARAGGERVVLVEHHDGDAVLCQVDRAGETHRPGADHDHPMMHRRRRRLVRRADIGEPDRLGAAAVHDAPPAGRMRPRPARRKRLRRQAAGA